MHSQVVAGVTTVNNLPVYFLANNLDDIMSDGDKKKKKTGLSKQLIVSRVHSFPSISKVLICISHLHTSQ